MRLALGLLRAHVRGRAEDLAVDGHRHVAGLPLGQAEVHQLRLAAFVEHDVGGLDVAMDDAHLVGVLQRVGDGGDELRRLAGRRPLGRQQIGQRDPLDEFADQVREASRLADFVDRHDRRMPQLGDAAGLPQEPLDVAFAGHLPRSRNLDRHDAVEFGVAGLVHGAEGARPHQINELVAAEPPLDFTRAPLGRRVRVKLDAQSAGGAEEFFRRRILGQLDGTLATRAEDRAHFRRVAAECRRRGGNGVNCPLTHKAAAAFVRFEERINPAAKGHIVPARGG